MQHEHAAAVFRRYLLAGLAFAAVAGLLALLYQLKLVILMLAFAGFLAYFLAWPVGMLTRYMPRPAATRIVFYIFFLIIVGNIPTVGAIVYYQGALFYQNLPALLEKLPQQYDSINQFVIQLQQQYMPGQAASGLDVYIKQIVDQMQNGAPDIVSKAVGVTQGVISTTSAVLAGVFVVPIIALYFMLDSARLRRSMVLVFAPRLRPDVEKAMDAINRSLGGYIYSRVILAAFMGISMAIVLAILDVPYWLVLAFGVFIGEFIPVAGGILAFIPITIVCLVTDPIDLVWALSLVLALNLIQNYIISPKLVGETMNIHPLTVVIAMLIGGSVGGVAGLLLALPAAAAVKILLNIFVFKRDDKGITVPKLEVFAMGNANKDAASEASLPDDFDPR